ncbi:MAG: hypothetical protein WA843_04725, partial [Candidatus Saccharimonadales bacterium]
MSKLRRVNSGLIVAVIAVNCYILLLPLYPVLHLWWEQHMIHRPEKLTHLVQQTPQKSPSIPAGEWLIIPKLALDTPVYEGPNIYTAN